MTNPERNFMLMDVARMMGTRNPIASAVLVKGHERIHVAEYLDGNSVLMLRNTNRKKSKFLVSGMEERGESSVVAVKTVKMRIPEIVQEYAEKGYSLKVKEVQPVNLPLLPMMQIEKAA